jgi:amidase
MARTVKDAAYLLTAIAGQDQYDNYTHANPNGKKPLNYVTACDYNSLRGKRFGVPWDVINYYNSDPSATAAYQNNPVTAPVIAAFNASLAVLANAGAVIVPTNLTVPGPYNSGGNETIVLDADFIVNIATYLKELTYNPNNITTLKQLRDWTESFPGEQWSPTSRDVGIWNESLALGFNNTSPQFWEAYQNDLYLGGEAGLFGSIARDNLSAVLLPTQFAPSFAAIVGAPVVTVPMGFYPANTSVVMNGFGNLVATAPNIVRPICT